MDEVRLKKKLLYFARKGLSAEALEAAQELLKVQRSPSPNATFPAIHAARIAAIRHRRDQTLAALFTRGLTGPPAEEEKDELLEVCAREGSGWSFSSLAVFAGELHNFRRYPIIAAVAGNAEAVPATLWAVPEKAFRNVYLDAARVAANIETVRAFAAIAKLPMAEKYYCPHGACIDSLRGRWREKIVMNATRKALEGACSRGDRKLAHAILDEYPKVWVSRDSIVSSADEGLEDVFERLIGYESADELRGSSGDESAGFAFNSGDERGGGNFFSPGSLGASLEQLALPKRKDLEVSDVELSAAFKTLLLCGLESYARKILKECGECLTVDGSALVAASGVSVWFFKEIFSLIVEREIKRSYNHGPFDLFREHYDGGDSPMVLNKSVLNNCLLDAARKDNLPLFYYLLAEWGQLLKDELRTALFSVCFEASIETCRELFLAGAKMDAQISLHFLTIHPPAVVRAAFGDAPLGEEVLRTSIARAVKWIDAARVRALLAYAASEEAIPVARLVVNPAKDGGARCELFRKLAESYRMIRKDVRHKARSWYDMALDPETGERLGAKVWPCLCKRAVWDNYVEIFVSLRLALSSQDDVVLPNFRRFAKIPLWAEYVISGETPPAARQPAERCAVQALASAYYRPGGLKFSLATSQ